MDTSIEILFISITSFLSGRDAKYLITANMPIYFISLVGTDAGDKDGKGIPRKALSFFDVFSEMEIEDIDGITFLSVQDLLKFYQEETGRNEKSKNAYELVLFFIKRNPDALYFVDEVPLIKNHGKLIWNSIAYNLK